MTSISNNAFQYCYGLKSLSIPSSVTTIGDYAFACCLALTSVTIPNSVTTIGESAFRDCEDLTDLTIGGNVTSIGSYAFYGCSGLTSVTVEMSTPVVIEEETFSNIKNIILYVPVGSKAAYKAANVWKDFGTVLEQGTVLTEKDRIYGDNVNVYIGYTEDLQISMMNENSFTAYQFELVLPDGMTIAKNENDKYLVAKGNRYSDDSHQVSIEDLGDNTFRFICVSLHNGIIDGTDGALLSVSLKASAEMAEGIYDASIRNIIMTTTDEKRFSSKDCLFTIETMTLLKGDANGDNEIDVIDVVSIINCILGNPSATFNYLAADLNDDGEIDVFDAMMAIDLALAHKAAARSMARAAVNTGELAKVTPTVDGIMLDINNPERFTAFQFDVEVSDGVELTEARLAVNSGHILQFVKNGENTYRVIGLSMNNSTLSASGNGLVELSFSKVGHVQINNIVFVTPQEDRVFFTSGDAVATGIGSIGYEQSEEIFDLSGRKVDTDRSSLPKGVYIINNKKVVIK